MYSTVCIPNQCSFCQFEFDELEYIVIVHDGGELTTKLVCDIGFRGDEEYSQCDCECSHDDGQAVVSHPGCVKLIPYKPREFALVVAHNYHPSLGTTKRRTSRLLSELTSSLALPHALPHEIRREIAQYLLPEYAAAKAGSYCLRFLTPIDVHVELSAKIWARYIEFEGVKYVASLTNQGDGVAHDLLFDPSSQTVQAIYISQDHLGIRQVYFTDSADNSIPTRSADVWWRTYYSPSLGASLVGKTDGVKLRSLDWPVSYAQPYTMVYDAPGRPIRKYRLWSLGKAVRPQPMPHIMLTGFSKPLSRMASFLCNDPAITGYSFCWNDRLKFIHAHIANESPAFDNMLYSDDKHNIWLYMPIQAGEFITGIWKRFRDLDRETALVMKTNKGQVMVAGPHRTPGWPTGFYTVLDIPGDVSSRIYFDTHSEGIDRLGFESKPPETIHKNPSLNYPQTMPTSLYPETRKLENFFYTAASLLDVTEITPCRSNKAGVSAITGMLICYANGNKASIGQVRLDYLEEPLRVDPLQPVCLEFLETKGGFPYVANIYASHSERRCKACLDIGWNGQLEWWFSWRQCRLHYGERSSPETI